MLDVIRFRVKVLFLRIKHENMSLIVPMMILQA